MPHLPKHLQPLDNKNVDSDLIRRLRSIVFNKRVNPLHFTDDVGLSIEYRDISKPKNLQISIPLQNAKEAAKKRIDSYIYDHSSSLWAPLNSKTYKISRVESMSAAVLFAASRTELVTIYLSLVSIINNLRQVKPNPLLPKYLQPMTTDEPPQELRKLLEDLLTCPTLDINHFKGRKI